MMRPVPIEPELARQIANLGSSEARLSLMSVAALSMPQVTLLGAVHLAADQFDLVGLLPDGSIGVVSLRSVGPDGGAGVEQRFLPRLKTAISAAQRRGAIAAQWFWFRSVHRWASELSGASDLIDTLFNMPARPMSTIEASAALSGNGLRGLSKPRQGALWHTLPRGSPPFR